MFLAVDKLSRSFGADRILKNVTFDVADGEIVSIIGPSGVGKTTLLHQLAGLDAPDSGIISFATPPSKSHPVILVFQDYVLFPNMTVFENVAFGLRSRKLPAAEIKSKVMEMLGWFGLVERREHFPVQLSAGQRQRVAIARAMIVEPMLLLLDEPFANLDRGLKMQTAEFIRDTQKRFGVTTIAVTHDLEEAFVMSDRIGLMLGGRLVQFDTPREVYARPVDSEAARFLGPVNVIGRELLPLLDIKGRAGSGDLLVRPECIRLQPDEEGHAEVLSIVFAGHYSKYTVSVGESELVAYGANWNVEKGDRVRIVIEDCHIL